MKIEVVGNVVVMQLDHSVEEIQKVEARMPEALKIMDDETKATKFQLSTKGMEGLSSSCMTVNKNGVNGKAVFTIGVDNATVENVRAFITERFGTALLRVNAIEQQLAAAIADINRQNSEIASLISVHGDNEANSENAENEAETE